MADAIEGLRVELIQAWQAGRDKGLRFRPSPVELTLQVGATAAGTAKAGASGG